MNSKQEEVFKTHVTSNRHVGPFRYELNVCVWGNHVLMETTGLFTVKHTFIRYI